MSIKLLRAVFTILYLLLCIQPNLCFQTGLLFADSGNNTTAAKKANEARAQAKIQPTLDARLPPVLPGEELSRNGKKIKVWSTSGSPSVTEAVPSIPSPSQNWTVDDGRGQGLSVIVDGRDLLPNHRKP